MFEIHKTRLHDLLRFIDEGRMQLPEFQRDYVWADADVRSLIASIARGFPVGALLTLEAGSEVNFKPRHVEGAPTDRKVPDTLLLDGQQRMTSLYQALFSSHPVKTPGRSGKAVWRHYFLDMNAALAAGGDMIDAIEWTGEDRKRLNPRSKELEIDGSTPEAQYEHKLFPLDRTFDASNWKFGYYDYWKTRDVDALGLLNEFDRSVLNIILNYEMPLIRLLRGNSREAICLIFEKVNVGGKKLDAFELVTAIFAGEGKEGFDLRADWQKRKAAMLSIAPGQERDVLRDVDSVNFLQVSSFLHTRARRHEAAQNGLAGKDLPQVSIRRKDVLSLPFSSYTSTADAVTSGFRKAAAFLNDQKIIWHKDVPYPPQIVALASFFAAFGKGDPNAPQLQKVAQWFWSVALGEEYGSSTETKIARDVSELLEWVDDRGDGPRTMREAQFNPGRLDTLRTRLSAAYKAIHALLMKEGGRDFITGRPIDLMTFHNDSIDIHHVFPQAWCEAQGISADIYNSILNKAPLSASSNRSIGGNAPSVYLAAIRKQHGIGQADQATILNSHLLDEEAMLTDDFDRFIDLRRQALVSLIQRAMGRSVAEDVDMEEAS